MNKPFTLLFLLGLFMLTISKPVYDTATGDEVPLEDSTIVDQDEPDTEAEGGDDAPIIIDSKEGAIVDYVEEEEFEASDATGDDLSGEVMMENIEEIDIAPPVDAEEEEEATSDLAPPVDAEEEEEEEKVELLPSVDAVEEEENELLPGVDAVEEEETELLPGVDAVEEEENGDLLPSVDGEEEEEEAKAELLPSVDAEEEELGLGDLFPTLDGENAESGESGEAVFENVEEIFPHGEEEEVRLENVDELGAPTPIITSKEDPIVDFTDAEEETQIGDGEDTFPEEAVFENVEEIGEWFTEWLGELGEDGSDDANYLDPTDGLVIDYTDDPNDNGADETDEVLGDESDDAATPAIYLNKKESEIIDYTDEDPDETDEVLDDFPEDGETAEPYEVISNEESEVIDETDDPDANGADETDEVDIEGVINEPDGGAPDYDDDDNGGFLHN